MSSFPMGTPCLTLVNFRDLEPLLLVDVRVWCEGVLGLVH